MKRGCRSAILLSGIILLGLVGCRSLESLGFYPVTPTPVATARPYVTPVLTVGPSPEVTPEQTVTSTAVPTLTPTFTPTPEPTATATPPPTPSPSPTVKPLDITLCFAGDVSLADDAKTTEKWQTSGETIENCISPELLEVMRGSDLFCINNEFTFTERGKALSGKAYTFRAKPERVSVLHEMGVDLVQLANNHTFDFGEISLLDTLDTLEHAGIGYFGAGRNLQEVLEPYYVEVDGIRIAFVAASRAEKNKKTPQATEDTGGILRCYDTELFLELIRKADANADIVIANVHWGAENKTTLEQVQITTGKEYLDAGADIIIGGHTHCLQGIEFYNGKPIVYSLGNFWFNGKTMNTMLLKVHIYGERENPQLEISMVPALQSNAMTTYLSKAEDREKLFAHIEKLSVNAEVDEDGRITEKTE